MQSLEGAKAMPDYAEGAKVMQDDASPNRVNRAYWPTKDNLHLSNMFFIVSAHGTNV